MMAFSQRSPTVPTEINFSGARVQLDAQGQQRLQEEVTNLYANRSLLRNAIEQQQYIESVLGPLMEERAMPADFRYACLPGPTANGAYWGLDARKATRLNLRIDNSVDERLNVASSSEAVLNELANLHATYPNWMQVLLNYATSYPPNSPVSNVLLPNDQTQLAADAPPLIWATLARKFVFERETPLLRPNATPYLLYDYRQSQGKSLAAIARELKIEQTRFIPFNDWLRVRVIPANKAYPVLIRLTPAEFLAVRGQINSTVQLGQPTQSDGLRNAAQRDAAQRNTGFPVLRKLSASPSSDPITRMSAQFYQINDRKGIQAQPCDNLITLSYYGQLSVQLFMKINDLTDRDLIRPGEIYYLENKARKAMIPFHVMQDGQTLREVSTTYGIRMKLLLKYNHLAANQRVQPGRILWLREKRPANLPAEYQILPSPVPVAEPTVAQRKLTRENEESVIDSPSPPTRRTQPADSVNSSVKAGTARPALAGLNRPAVTATPDLPGSTTAASPVAALPGKAIPAPKSNRENADSAIDVDFTAKPPAKAPPRPERLVNQVRLETPKTNGRSFYHIVQRGQTVYRVALINKVRVQDVMRWNNLTGYTIEIGQRILIRK